MAAKANIDNVGSLRSLAWSRTSRVCGEVSGGVIAALSLNRLGVAVGLVGRCTAAGTVLRDHVVAAGIDWQMEVPNGSQGHGPCLGGHVGRASGPIDIPSAEEVRYLVGCQARAIVISKSVDNQYAQFLIEIAAAIGIPVFWNADAQADLRPADSGANVYLQVSSRDFGGNATSLATTLIGETGAAGVVVTDAERGAYGTLRGNRAVLHVPGLLLAQEKRAHGASDSHLAGFVAAFLQTPKPIRLERGMALGQLVAARYVSGHEPADWRELRRFEGRHRHGTNGAQNTHGLCLVVRGRTATPALVTP